MIVPKAEILHNTHWLPGIQFDTSCTFSVPKSTLQSFQDSIAHHSTGHCAIAEEGLTLEQDLPTRAMKALANADPEEAAIESWFG